MTDSTQLTARRIYPEATIPHRPEGVADPRRDGCPNCLSRDNAPIDVGYASGGYYASYRCGTCGATWWAAWTYEPTGGNV